MKLTEKKPTGVTFRPKGVDRTKSIRRGVGRTARAGSFEMFKGVIKPDIVGRGMTADDMSGEVKKAGKERRDERMKKEELPPAGTKKEFPSGIYQVMETISGKKKWSFVSNPNAMPKGVHAPSLRF